jgi:hypothetical protein
MSRTLRASLTEDSPPPFVICVSSLKPAWPTYQPACPAGPVQVIVDPRTPASLVTPLHPPVNHCQTRRDLCPHDEHIYHSVSVKLLAMIPAPESG